MCLHFFSRGSASRSTCRTLFLGRSRSGCIGTPGRKPGLGLATVAIEMAGRDWWTTRREPGMAAY